MDFFQRVVALQQRYADGKRIENGFQTNGILLDDRWGGFLARHGFLVGLSIDGPRALHDAYRMNRGGQPTFDQVMRGRDVLRRHGVDFNTLNEALAESSSRWRSAGRKSRRSRSIAASANASAGRNDPCPCGSGKKFKNCCGA